jgi:hypothetical protein
MKKEHTKLHRQLEQNQQQKQQKPLQQQQTMEPFVDVRPHMQNIYLPLRQQMSCNTCFLTRTTMVVMVRGPPNPAIVMPALANTLARINGWHPENYKIQIAEITPLLVICRGPASRDAICQTHTLGEERGVYELTQHISVRLFPWDPSYGMVFSPSQYRVWLSLTGLPLQAWNRSSIRQICAPYRYIEMIKPYLLPICQFRALRVLIITVNPTKITMHL